MRTIIDLTDAQLESLRVLERRYEVSRAELVRQAIAEFVSKHLCQSEAFGAWKSRRPAKTGVKHQRKLRAEWAR
jgi:Ribbon-helix-helix domain